MNNIEHKESKILFLLKPTNFQVKKGYIFEEENKVKCPLIAQGQKGYMKLTRSLFWGLAYGRKERGNGKKIWMNPVNTTPLP